MRQPVLAVWGGADDVVPVHDSAVRIGASLRAAGNDDVTFAAFPRADHSLVVRGEAGDPVPGFPGISFASGYLDLTAGWLRARLGRGRTPRVPRVAPPTDQAGPPSRSVAAVSWFGSAPVQAGVVLALAGGFALVLAAAAGLALPRRRRAELDRAVLRLSALVAGLGIVALLALFGTLASILAVGGDGLVTVAGLPVGWAVLVLVVVVVALASARLVGRLLSARARVRGPVRAVGGTAAAGAAMLLVLLGAWLH